MYVQMDYLCLSGCEVKIFVLGFWSDTQDIFQVVSCLYITAVMLQREKLDKPSRTQAKT